MRRTEHPTETFPVKTCINAVLTLLISTAAVGAVADPGRHADGGHMWGGEGWAGWFAGPVIMVVVEPALRFDT